MEDTVAQQPDAQKAPVFDNPDRNLAMELVRAAASGARPSAMARVRAGVSQTGAFCESLCGTGCPP